MHLFFHSDGIRLNLLEPGLVLLARTTTPFCPVQPRILSEDRERFPPWKTISGGAEGGMEESEDCGWENARDRLPAVPN